ncbi:MAG: hypothetical protein NXH88_07755 [Hyphomonas sp.]|nr:hypothetical protein [Hyphomonas sp.]
MNKVAALAALSAFSVATASAQEVGRWCDIPVPGLSSIDNLMVMKAEGGSEYTLELTYGDGSGTARKLTKSDSKYLAGDSFGEYYVIRSNGQLAIYDAEGFIRVARVASRVTRVGDCR